MKIRGEDTWCGPWWAQVSEILEVGVAGGAAIGTGANWHVAHAELIQRAARELRTHRGRSQRCNNPNAPHVPALLKRAQ